MKAMIKLFLPWLCLWSVSWTASAQWTSETYVVRPGWNGIYALNDCSHVTFDSLLAAYPDVMSVWRWEPSNLTSQFIGDPTQPVAGQEWKTWVRGEPQNSTMTAMIPNFAYLIYVREAKSVPPQITLNLTGGAVVTRLEWRSSGSNLLGFPSNASPQPTFGSTTVGYLAPLAGLGYNPASTRIFQYVGGKLSNKNPEQVLSLTQAGITRGKAYWIDLPIHSDFVSPVQLTLSDLSGFHFGKLGTSKRLRVTNLGNAASTITVTPTPSLAAPAGQPVISGGVPLLLRVWNQSTERFEYEPITGPLTASLAPKASAEWVVIPDRSAMGGTVGSLYASILKITDSTNYANLTVPVSAEVAGVSGLWVGTAAITNVANELNRFERDANGETIYDEQGNPIPLPLDPMGSATAQPFSLRLIVHVNAQGEARLLSNVYYGLLDSDTIGFAARHQSFAGLSSERVVAYSDDAIIGQRIPPPPLPPGDGGVISRAGYILPSGGTAYDVGAYVDPLLPSTSDSFSRAEAVSEIIPVNALAGNDQLTVWWFRKVLPPSPSFRPLYWPSIVAVYDLQWRPVDPDPESELVIARNNGSGDLPPGLASGFIYFQNDPDLHGYNPNEEHALMLGGRAYALRDDLNRPDSSPPRVLVSYVADDRRPAMQDFVVLRERAPYFFDYPALAGTLLQAPAPLPFLPLPVDENGINHNSEILGGELDAGDDTPAYYDSFAFEDRKSQHWIYRGPHAGGTPFFQMRYAYKTLPGFAFPDDDSPPEVGSIQPFLRSPDGVGGYLEETLPVTFRPTWPENVPVLQFGQTLAKAQFGLPAVRGQTSLQVVYEQSRAQSPLGDVGSVSLFDPTRAKHYFFGPAAALETLPPSIATDSRNGKIFFQNLPPHLKERFFFDPIVGMDGALVLEGRFIDDVVGDDYLLLNVLSGPDLEDIQSLVPASDGNNKLAWDTLVQELTTTVESETVPGTYVPEDDFDQTYDSAGIPLITHPDQAVDSYAMAAVGDGQGYVTLTSGNGEAFTPENEPVSFHIIRVDVPMNKGQLKIVASSNPLDEQVTLRHSGDFAANPQLFDFEWRYSPPMDGVAPILDASPDNPGSAWIPITEAGLLNFFVVRGAGIQTLSDNYWILRYRPKSFSHPVRQGQCLAESAGLGSGEHSLRYQPHRTRGWQNPLRTNQRPRRGGSEQCF